jgi:hypothetical protein
MKQLSENDSKRVAQAWAEQYGKSLLAEEEAMREQGVSYQMPRADRAMQKLSSRRGRSAKRRRTAMLTALAAAACLVIVVWVAGIPSFITPSSTSPEDAGVDSSAPLSDATKIPVSFDLPADYRVATSDYDNGMSVYALKSASRGDVVLTMYHENERQADAPADAADAGAPAADAAAQSGGSFVATDEVIIDGTTVSAKVDEAYMLLTFEQGGVRYTLSDRDDMGVLAAFYRSIIRAVP